MPKFNKKGTSCSVPKINKNTEDMYLYNPDILEGDLGTFYPQKKASGSRLEEDTSNVVMYRINCVKGDGLYEGRVDFRVSRGSRHILSRENIEDKDTRRKFGLPGGDWNTLQVCGNNERVSTPHCKVQGAWYPDDVIWIQDLQSKFGTFVNGRRIPSGETHVLTYGDVIGLGSPYHTIDQWGNPKDKKRGYVFTLKNFRTHDDAQSEPPPSLSDPKDPTPSYLALNNSVILHTIFTFLRHKDKKASRLVSRGWRNLLDPQFFRLSSIHFCHGDEYRCSVQEEWDINFPKRVEMMRKCEVGNWNISLFHEEKCPRVNADVQWLLEHQGHLVKILRFSAQSWPHPLSKFPSVMSHLKNLETLSLGYLPFPSTLDLSSSFPITFPSVKSLDFRIYVGPERPNRHRAGAEIISQLVQMFPNIEKYEAKCYGTLQDVVTYIHHDNPGGSWNNLQELSCRFSENPRNNQEVFSMISTLDQKLTKIDLCVKFYKGFDIHVLERMVNHHSLTLEQLALSLWMEVGVEVLKFPSFPNLKLLHLSFLEFQKSQVILQPRIVFTSSTSGVEERLDVFVPKGEGVCRTMRWVDFGIRHEAGELLDLDNPWYKGFLGRFTKVFPYVNDPHVIKDLKLLNIQG